MYKEEEVQAPEASTRPERTPKPRDTVTLDSHWKLITANVSFRTLQIELKGLIRGASAEGAPLPGRAHCELGAKTR